MTLKETIRELATNPQEHLIRRWNWKSALFSSLPRAFIILAVNLSAGWGAARGAMFAEIAYRALTSGFYGSMAQPFRKVTPAWKGSLGAMVFVPAIAHSFEFGMHWLRGTPNLKATMGASILFSIVSTLFNLHAMRHDALLVGEGSATIAEDMRRMPGVIASFLTAGPRALAAAVQRARV